MNTHSRNIIVVCGPTASGKTRLAVSLARRLDAEIISADSRQVYRSMDIGTGKDLDEYGRGGDMVPHHCIDIADPNEIYTVYRYQRDCYGSIRSVWSRGKIPVLAGGTGLYIEAIIKGYRIAEVAENEELREALMAEEKDALELRLKELDARIYERTDRSSKKRIVRALEVAMHAKKRAVMETENGKTPGLSPLVLAVRWPRSELLQSIDRRLDERLKQGMIDEVRRLKEQGISSKRLEMLGMEYKHISRCLDGETEYDTMVEKLRADIHRLAKRQMTWFRGMERRGVEVHWIDRADYDSAMNVIDRFSFAPIPLGIDS